MKRLTELAEEDAAEWEELLIKERLRAILREEERHEAPFKASFSRGTVIPLRLRFYWLPKPP